MCTQKKNPRSAAAERGRFQFPKEVKLLGSGVLLGSLLGLLGLLGGLLLGLLGGVSGAFGSEGNGESGQGESGDDLLHDGYFPLG